MSNGETRKPGCLIGFSSCKQYQNASFWGLLGSFLSSSFFVFFGEPRNDRQRRGHCRAPRGHRRRGWWTVRWTITRARPTGTPTTTVDGAVRRGTLCQGGAIAGHLGAAGGGPVAVGSLTKAGPLPGTSGAPTTGVGDGAVEHHQSAANRDTDDDGGRRAGRGGGRSARARPLPGTLGLWGITGNESDRMHPPPVPDGQTRKGGLACRSIASLSMASIFFQGFSLDPCRKD